MRKQLAGIMAAVLLCGCGAQPTFETVNDDDSLLVSTTTRQVLLDLPKEAATPAMQAADGGSLYLCDGYTLTVQTFAGGDLNATVRQVTGFPLSQLQTIRMQTADAVRYDLVWTAAGEGGDQVARGVILDDGLNHYVVTVMAEAALAGDLQTTWQDVLSSVSLDTDQALPGKA